MKKYKYEVRLKGKTIARSTTLAGIAKQYVRLRNYLSDTSIKVNPYLKKGETFCLNDLEIKEL